jgi:hypothetical protein
LAVVCWLIYLCLLADYFIAVAAVTFAVGCWLLLLLVAVHVVS